MATPDERSESWHLSKSVPISLILALIVQTIVISGAWFTHVADFANFKELVMSQMRQYTVAIDDRYRKSEAIANLEVRDVRIANLETAARSINTAVQNLQATLIDRMDKLGDRVQRSLDAHTTSGNGHAAVDDSRGGGR